MQDLKQTARLEREESEKRTIVDATRAKMMLDEPDLISPDRDGIYQIKPIECFSDCIAIAPFPVSGVSAGGIALPTVQNKDVGIVLGTPSTMPANAPHYPAVGQVVSFSSKMPIADITGKIPEYGNTKIMIVRIGNVFAALQPVKFNII